MRLKRFVGGGRWVVEGEAAQQEASGFENIVAEAVTQPSSLRGQLPWLVSANLRRGFEFGRRLAGEDHEFSTFWPPLAQVLTEGRLTDIGPFPCGYLAGVFARDPAHWESLIQQLIQSDLPKSRIAALVVGTGMTESVAALFCQWLENEDIAAEILTRLALSTPDSRLPSDQLRRCLDALLRRTDLAAAVAVLETVAFTLERAPAAFDDAFIGRVLLNPALFGARGHAAGVSQVPEYQWATLAARWASDDADRLNRLVEALLTTFDDVRGIFQRYGESREVLRRAFRVVPHRAWTLVARLLVSGDRRLSYVLSHWLRGED